jgi:hypothetical protein
LILFEISPLWAIPGHSKRLVSRFCCHVDIDELVTRAVHVRGWDELSGHIVQIGEDVDFECFSPNLFPLLLFFGIKLNQLRKLAPLFAVISMNFLAMLQFTRLREHDGDRRFLNCGIEFRSIMAFAKGLCFCFAREES